jgi:hypothetical protein
MRPILALAVSSNAFRLTQVDDDTENVLAQRKNINRRAGTIYSTSSIGPSLRSATAAGGIFIAAAAAATAVGPPAAHS